MRIVGHLRKVSIEGSINIQYNIFILFSDMVSSFELEACSAASISSCNQGE